MAKLQPTGTREWASVNYNIQNRCSHGCKYCYACAMAVRFGRVRDYTEWAKRTPEIDTKKVNKKWKLVKGTIMFPTTHDITPLNIGKCVTAIGNMLRPGNRVLIVTKPHLTCVMRLCEEFEQYKEHILFRFTIGSTDSEVLRFWEPGATSFEERMSSLMFAFSRGFRTSVSSEPYLDGTVDGLVSKLMPYITDALWFGPMNGMETRVRFRGVSFREADADPKLWTEEEWRYWNIAKDVQTEDFIRKLYDRYKDNLKIKWKNRIKEVLGLPMPEEIGLDE